MFLFCTKGETKDEKKMRRSKQALSNEKCIEILNKNTSGVLALCGNQMEPYALPISYVYENHKIYFHCAKSGYKLDLIQENNQVSFCVIDQDVIVPEKYTTYFKSVIVFGNIHMLEDDDEKQHAIETLAIKYSPDESIQNRQEAIKKFWKALCLLELDIKDITGKQAIDLVDKRNEG